MKTVWKINCIFRRFVQVVHQESYQKLPEFTITKIWRRYTNIYTSEWIEKDIHDNKELNELREIFTKTYKWMNWERYSRRYTSEWTDREFQEDEKLNELSEIFKKIYKWMNWER